LKEREVEKTTTEMEQQTALLEKLTYEIKQPHLRVRDIMKQDGIHFADSVLNDTSKLSLQSTSQLNLSMVERESHYESI
jgi:hypothetical protein